MIGVWLSDHQKKKKKKKKSAAEQEEGGEKRPQKKGKGQLWQVQMCALTRLS